MCGHQGVRMFVASEVLCFSCAVLGCSRRFRERSCALCGCAPSKIYVGGAVRRACERCDEQSAPRFSIYVQWAIGLGRARRSHGQRREKNCSNKQTFTKTRPRRRRRDADPDGGREPRSIGYNIHSEIRSDRGFEIT